MTNAQMKRGLARLLKRPEWTITKVAAELGASYFTVLNWTKGRSNVSNAYAHRLVALLNRETKS